MTGDVRGASTESTSSAASNNVTAPSLNTDAPLSRVFLRGGISLGGSAALQRSLNFVATTLAARLAGPAAFGSYSLALSTAGVVADYLGLGVGTSASRFAGQFPRHSAAYRRLVLLMVASAGATAIVASAAMYLFAVPLSRLVSGDEAIVPVLRAAGASASVFVVFGALNGTLLGLLNFTGTFWLAASSGACLIVALALTSRAGAEYMVLGHAASLGVAAIVTIVATWRTMKPLPNETTIADGVEPLQIRQFTLFGLTQLSANLGISLSSWVVAIFVSQSDASLQQMGYYAVGNQMRTLAAVAPGLIAQLVFPLLGQARKSGRSPQHVITVSTVVSVGSAVAVASLALLALPLILVAYGSAYDQAAVTVVFLIGTAAVHMSFEPSTRYLTTVDLGAVAVINVIWTFLLILAAFWTVPMWGSAGAGLAWLFGHSCAAGAVVFVLARKHLFSRKLGQLVLLAAAGIGTQTTIALVRAAHPEMALVALVLQVIAVSAFATSFMLVANAGPRLWWLLTGEVGLLFERAKVLLLRTVGQ